MRSRVHSTLRLRYRPQPFVWGLHGTCNCCSHVLSPRSVCLVEVFPRECLVLQEWHPKCISCKCLLEECQNKSITSPEIIVYTKVIPSMMQFQLGPGESSKCCSTKMQPMMMPHSPLDRVDKLETHKEYEQRLAVNEIPQKLNQSLICW